MKPKSGLVYEILQGQYYVPQPIEKPKYYKDPEYLNLLEKNFKKFNVPYKPKENYQLNLKEYKIKPIECHLEYLDKVDVELHVQKNGKIKVKLSTCMCNLYDKYYKNGRVPPIKTIISTYRNIGYSEAFISMIKKKYNAKKIFKEKLGDHLTRIFDKGVIKTFKKEPEKEPEEDDELSEDEDEQSEHEWEGLEDDNEENDDIEDEYYSDED